MGASPQDSIATLFGELAELSAPIRAERLAALDTEHPALAGELRQLLAADAAAGDFLGALGEADRARAVARVDRAPSITEGSQVGPYLIMRPLGSGGMATVWLAHDERLDRPIALKVLGNAWAGDAPHREGARARFLTEARTAASLDHPNVATVYDVGEASDGQLFIAMAHCEGGSLAERLVRGPVQCEAALRIARELASALEAAHARGIVHRDVKPANVLFDAAGRLRLADFGIATLSGQGTSHSGVVLGTAAYLAPEQLRGGNVDHRADLWALGVTLYETLAGRRPFVGGSYAAVLHDVLVAEPTPVDRLVTMPAALAALVHQLLSKDPDARPQSAAEVSRVLETIGVEPRDRTAVTPRSVARLTGAAAPLTSLVGRERELAISAALLERARLVTLTGPGGTGKTRIAMQLARRTASRYANGAHVVPLAAVSSPDDVAVAVCESLGLRMLGDMSAVERASRHLATIESLLVLDNFEQVLDAAPFVATLLEAAPRLTILVTSRAPLRVRGEQELPVPPLALPAAEDVTSSQVGEAAAVRLFVERAVAVRPDFELDDENALQVATLCRRLDGLPLAIELAAARVKLLSPRALLARLERPLELLRTNARDAEPRHRTMRAVIDWSYTLLTAREQALFRRLSVFVNGFSMEALAAMEHATTDDGDDAITPLELATSLHDNSLLLRSEQSDGEPRFDLLETVREYALQRLTEAGELDAARATHRAHFLALAEEAAPHLRGPEQLGWLRRLEREQDNLRAALDDGIAADDLHTAARLGVALHRYWLVSRSFLGGTLERLETLDVRLRARPSEAVPPGLHAALLVAIGLLAGVRDAPADVAYRWFDGALELYRRAGDADAVATTQNHLAWSSQLLGDYVRGASFARDALAHHGKTSNLLGEAIARSNLGWIALQCGELSDAELHLQRSLAIHRERADPRACAYALSFSAAVALERGDGARAIALREEALAIGEPLADRVFTPTERTRWVLANHLALRDVGGIERLRSEIVPRIREVGHAFSVGLALACLGELLLHDDQLADARAALEESLSVRRRSRHLSSVAHSEALLAEVAMRSGDAATSAALWRSSIECRMAMGEVLAVAGCVEGIARLALGQGDAPAAARLAAGAAAHRARLGSALPPRSQSSAEAHWMACGRVLGEEALASERSRGIGTTLPELVSLALGVVTGP